MSPIRINLYSDTQTLPTPAMRKAMAEAPVGDEQRGEDPSVNRLCEVVAELTGKEAAVFLPSGTMCNEIAICVHCRPGDEIITDRTAHILNLEGGAPAALSGASIWPLEGIHGVFTAAQLQQGIRPQSRHTPRSRLVCVEQTANLGGGTVWPLETIQAVAEMARTHQLALHMDGARLFNAVIATGIDAREHTASFDSVWFDLSKGLGCPVGGVLAGSAAFIEEAWWWKQRLGGAMRQAGILAAAGLYALEHHIERLAEDHRNARRFAEHIAEIPGISVALATVETNIVFFDVTATGLSAAEVSDKLKSYGVLIGATDKTRLRAVTHLDISQTDIETAAKALREIC
ncbi:threonine aldolase family protein [Nitrosococcus wardiae]|uniref:Low specificity L-threonine aldolase n=1 Tax=Nitrosococcus wardiae TaxID=1814290 RepID=A0A4P7BYS1_9GAMM|nr:threonine aldolase family protein [Nitrosococcus wardiae]QBQ53642.1 low specificity L-threonine aldolase [Nitrosococcus wardiae]